MVKKGMLLVVTIIMLLCVVCTALAEKQTISSNCNTALFYQFDNGTTNVSSHTVATKKWNIVLNVTQGKYSGARSDGTASQAFKVNQTAAMKKYAESPTNVTYPSSIAPHTSHPKDKNGNIQYNKLTVSINGGSFTIVSKDTIKVVNGKESYTNSKVTSTYQFAFNKTFTR
ncbi:hypothetical protein JRC49_10195 [Clostridiales bacterium FE2011]|nr:hypothetical protein JRC49_10195 [Clostridiales bacterium FE2011]